MEMLIPLRQTVADEKKATTQPCIFLKISSCWLTDTFLTQSLAWVIRSEKSSGQDYFRFQAIRVAMRSEISG